MLIFYRTEDCQGCKGIQSTLEAMRVAHKVVIVKKGPISVPGASSKVMPPVLIDEKIVIEGKDKIVSYLEKFEEFMQEWYKFQSDACYCDEEGNII
ncbi:MAG: hypothetical protein NC923_05835 [Candidatus Omnitrophica bacterium]|nr:hypothetical protein [Candidatus Omnitrophota bacterium]